MNRIFILAALVSVMSLAGCPDNNPRRERAPAADPPEAGAPGAVCGAVVCAPGQVCCNASCGICTPPGGVCIQMACPPVSGACRADSDCRLFDDYCTGCDCRALGKSDPNPTCSGPGVRCLRQPCADSVAACVAGKCTAHPAMQDRAAPSQ